MAISDDDLRESLAVTRDRLAAAAVEARALVAELEARLGTAQQPIGLCDPSPELIEAMAAILIGADRLADLVDAQALRLELLEEIALREGSGGAVQDQRLADLQPVRKALRQSAVDAEVLKHELRDLFRVWSAPRRLGEVTLDPVKQKAYCGIRLRDLVDDLEKQVPLLADPAV